MSIPTGCYTVTNVKNRNLALLPDPNNGTALAMSDERGNLGEKVFFDLFLSMIRRTQYYSRVTSV
jgi:hypothetical protein